MSSSSPQFGLVSKIPFTHPPATPQNRSKVISIYVTIGRAYLLAIRRHPKEIMDAVAERAG
jgi:hypothetical protein